MFTIYGGKTEFKQWEQGQRVTHPKMTVGDKAVFRNATGETHPMLAYKHEGVVVADVPNDLLQHALPLLVDLCESNECRTSFQVIAQDKPEGYEFIDNTHCEPAAPSGGGVTSWNDLTDKPFGETTVKGETIEWDGNTDGLVKYDGAPRYKVSDKVFTDVELEGATIEVIFKGEKRRYTLTTYYDGMEFDENKAYYMPLSYAPGADPYFHYEIYTHDFKASIVLTVVYGDSVLAGYPETGLYFEKQELVDYGDGNFIYDARTTALMFPDRTEIKPLDPKFLPEGAQAYKAVEDVRFVDNESRTSAFNDAYGAFGVFLGMTLEGMRGTEPCTIAWDGTTKTHNPVDMELLGMKFTAYGNMGMFAAFGVPGENTGEPYVLVFMEDGYSFFFTTDTSATNHIISVTGKMMVYHTIEQEYVGIPYFDLVEMGVPTYEMSTVFFTPTDASEHLRLMKAIKAGIVKIRVAIGNEVLCGFAMGACSESLPDRYLCMPVDQAKLITIGVKDDLLIIDVLGR